MIETPTPIATTAKNLPFKSHLLFAGTGPASLGWVRPHQSKLGAILKRALATVKCSSEDEAPLNDNSFQPFAQIFMIKADGSGQHALT
jgi:hypothetical protein